jgi:hypothetical protein
MVQLEEKFGYYLVHHGINEYHTCSKIEALQIAQRNNGWVSWHFNDEIYSTYDWSKPINEDIVDLYRQRAEQIRNKFDRVVIMYSGGYDSHNVLESFLKNNIKVDAVVSFYNSMDSKLESNTEIEWRLQTWPRLEPILKKYPDMRFVHLDVSQNSLDMIKLHYDDYYYIADGLLAPNFIGISYLKRLLPADLQTGNVAMVYGVDKPRIRYKDNQFIFNFYDQGYRVKPVINDSSIEYFYWTPDFPKLVIKQAQIAKQYWSADLELLTSHGKNKVNKDLGIVLDHDCVPLQQSIYPHCQNGTFLTWRPTNELLGNRDTWVYNSNTDTQQMLSKIYKSFVSNIDQSWFNQGKPTKGLISNISIDYKL